MSNTTTLTTPITQMTNNTVKSGYVDLQELNNFIGALLNDISIILTTEYGISTEARRSFDQSYSLQEFANSGQRQLLITYFSQDYSVNTNRCKRGGLNVEFDIFYRVEAKDNNKSILEQSLGIVEQLLCNNYIRQPSSDPNLVNESGTLTYTYNNKTFTTKLGGYHNELTETQIQYSKISDRNYYLAKQNYKFYIRYYSI